MGARSPDRSGPGCWAAQPAAPPRCRYISPAWHIWAWMIASHRFDAASREEFRSMSLSQTSSQRRSSSPLRKSSRMVGGEASGGETSVISSSRIGPQRRPVQRWRDPPTRTCARLLDAIRRHSASSDSPSRPSTGARPDLRSSRNSPPTERLVPAARSSLPRVAPRPVPHRRALSALPN